MPKKLYPADTVDQAKIVLSAWQQMKDAVPYGDVTQKSLEVSIEQVIQIIREMASLETRLTGLRDQRDDQIVALWDQVKRIRSGIKASYGDDSSQYEMVGGTRISEKKPYKKRSVQMTDAASKQ